MNSNELDVNDRSNSQYKSTQKKVADTCILSLGHGKRWQPKTIYNGNKEVLSRDMVLG